MEQSIETGPECFSAHMTNRSIINSVTPNLLLVLLDELVGTDSTEGAGP